MAYTFLAAQGFEVGASLLEQDQIDTCRDYIERARQNGVELMLPTDAVVADRFCGRRDGECRCSAVDSLRHDGLDIGPDTAKSFAAALADARLSSGTGRWGSSSSTHSPTARGRWPRRSRRSTVWR
jgi:phosphoglycerate kinase